MLSYYHDMDEHSEWILVNSSQVPWRSAEENALPYIQELGDFNANERYFTERSDLPSYLLVYVKSGDGILEYEGKNYSLMPGDCFWIDCHSYQKYYTDPKTGKWHTLWVHFYGQHCHEYYRLFRESNESPVFKAPASEDMEGALLSLISQYRQKYVDSTPDVKSAEVLVHLMTLAIRSGEQPKQGPVPEPIRIAREYIMEHFNQKISLDELCDKLHLSKHYFIRQFKKYVGTTPHRFVIDRRMHKAKILLRRTELSIAEIAEQTGFDHAAHLINSFKQIEGITPSRYRSQWKL